METVLWFLAIFCVVAVQSQTSLFSESKLCSIGHPDCYEKIITSFIHSPNRINCPGDKNQTCAEGYTCCLGSSGDYNCCPHEGAVCCADQIHCCPKGSSCDTVGGRCKKDSLASKKMLPSDQVTCPGDEFQCPTKTTCCKVSGGQYGCCPFEEASCCPDQLHCCPQGFDCGNGDVCVHSSNSNVSFSISNLN